MTLSFVFQNPSKRIGARWSAGVRAYVQPSASHVKVGMQLLKGLDVELV